MSSNKKTMDKKQSKEQLYKTWSELNEGAQPESLSSLGLEATKKQDDENIQEFLKLASKMEKE